MTATLVPDRWPAGDRNAVWGGAVVDVDVHVQVPDIETLFRYLPPMWVDWIRERGYRGPSSAAAVYPPASEFACRAEWRPADGAVPASTPQLLREHVLDPWRVDHAVLTCYYGVESLRHPDWAAALAGAVNDWLVDVWLRHDDRLRATMVLPARDPQAMLREISRVGDHPGFVQALFPARSDALWGQRIFHPVYAELARRDLVLGLHHGGTSDGAPSSTGFAAWRAEEYAAEWQAFATQLTSLIAEGVFTSVPDLRVSVLEGGFLWAAPWGWRMDKEWKALRREVPWLSRPPLEVLRDHVRFSTAPIDAGPPEHMARAVGWLGSEDLLMFATDYPHRRDDDIAALLAVLGPEGRRKVMADTARAWYRL